MDTPFLIKYRPRNLDDVKTDISIKKLLFDLIKIDNISIILIGESGTGKTSLINCIINEYYKNEAKAIKNDNILFVNSIKEQGIQHYKNEINVFCQTKCTIAGKKKTIIIDDLDNINEQNQQVFRNCLDRYQNNINFIFACINSQKILNSILSRVLSIKVKKPSVSDQIEFTKSVVSKENIDLNDMMIKKIVDLNDNSLQNILNSLEKLYLLDKKCSNNLLENISTFIENTTLDKLTNLIINEHELEKGIELVLDVYNQGYSVIDILDAYFNYIKMCNIVSEDIKYNVAKLICKYVTIINTVHDTELELCFFVNELVKLGYIYENK